MAADLCQYTICNKKSQKEYFDEKFSEICNNINNTEKIVQEIMSTLSIPFLIEIHGADKWKLALNGIKEFAPMLQNAHFPILLKPEFEQLLQRYPNIEFKSFNFFCMTISNNSSYYYPFYLRFKNQDQKEKTLCKRKTLITPNNLIIVYGNEKCDCYYEDMLMFVVMNLETMTVSITEKHIPYNQDLNEIEYCNQELHMYWNGKIILLSYGHKLFCLDPKDLQVRAHQILDSKILKIEKNQNNKIIITTYNFKYEFINGSLIEIEEEK